MRHLLWSAAALSAAALLGCAGGSSSPVSPPSASSSSTPSGALPTSVLNTPAALGTPSQAGLVQTAALALYTVTVDPSTLTATSALKATRAGQANDDLYLLSIDSFLNAKSFQVTGVSATGTTIDVEYVVKHPFPAPNNITGTPNGSTNRADLGISGMALFLVDVPTATGHTYFTDRVLNHDLVANADAYFSPGGLLTTSGTANTFPYRQLVDELADARLGVSNGGDVTGNFGSDGWTRSEFGPANDGWTGYGVLHQGQAAANTVSFNKGAIGGGFSLDVAMIAVYNDPRGGATPAQKKANRLPPASPDASLFAYRMPHGALDVHRVRLESQDGLFYADTISAVDFSFYVEDWDARATETTEADLATDPSFTNVAQGESGVPTLDICIPGILGDATVTAPIGTVIDDDTSSGGDPGEDSGRPGDAIFMTGLVTKPAGSGQVPNNYVGVVRAADAASGLLIGLDENLAPLAVTPASVTYQAFTVPLFAFNAPPSATVALTSGATLLSGTQAGVSITGIADADSDPLDISVDWGDGLGFVTVVSGLNSPYPAQTPSSPNMNNLDLTPDPIDVIVRLDDGTDQVDYPLSYTLGPNRPPQVTGTRALASASLPTPATFTMNAGTGTATDPEGDTISYTIVNNRNSDTLTFSAFPNAANTTPIANPPHATVTFTVYANDALHPTTSGTAYPTVNGTITSGGPLVGWAYTMTATTSGIDRAYSMVVDHANNVWVAGDWATNAPGADFGGGLRPNLTGDPFFLLKLNGTDGSWILDRTWNATSTSGRVFSVAVDGANNAYVYQSWNGTLNLAGLGGGAIDQTSNGTLEDCIILKFDSSGNFLGMARSNDTVSTSQESPTGLNSTTLYYGPSSRSMIVDGVSGRVYIGTSPSGAGTLDFGGTTVATNGLRDAVLVQYNTGAFTPAGAAANWAVNLVPSAAGGAANNQRIQSLALGPSDIIVAGVFDGTATANDFGDSAVLSNGGQDVFIVRYSSSGSFIAGSQRTFGTIASTANDTISSLDSNGFGYYVGGSWASGVGQNLSLGAPLGNLTSAGSTDGYLGMIDHTNTPVWQRLISGTTAEHVSGGIAVTNSDLFACGHHNSTNSDWGYGALPFVNSTEAVMAKYDRATGNASYWAQTWASSNFQYIFAVDLDSSANPIFLYKTTATTTIDFDPGPGVDSRTLQGNDFAIVKLSGATGQYN
ncbi:MAG: hypothetical protein GEEBNDBF_00857 [bacterium]|nr:hypothetical protein [bacterium]